MFSVKPCLPDYVAQYPLRPVVYCILTASIVSLSLFIFKKINNYFHKKPPSTSHTHKDVTLQNFPSTSHTHKDVTPQNFPSPPTWDQVMALCNIQENTQKLSQKTAFKRLQKKWELVPKCQKILFELLNAQTDPYYITMAQHIITPNFYQILGPKASAKKFWDTLSENLKMHPTPINHEEILRKLFDIMFQHRLLAPHSSFLKETAWTIPFSKSSQENERIAGFATVQIRESSKNAQLTITKEKDDFKLITFKAFYEGKNVGFIQFVRHRMKKNGKYGFFAMEDNGKNMPKHDARPRIFIWYVESKDNKRLRGVGTALMQAAIEYGKRRKVEQLVLYALHSAIPFYQKMGLDFIENHLNPSSNQYMYLPTQEAERLFSIIDKNPILIPLRLET